MLQVKTETVVEFVGWLNIDGHWYVISGGYGVPEIESMMGNVENDALGGYRLVMMRG